MNKLALSSFFDEFEKISKKVLDKNFKEDLISGAAKAAPWMESSVKGAIPAALAANFLIPGAEKGPWVGRKNKLVAAIGALGAGAGITKRYLTNWAEKNKRNKISKQILKTSAMAGDLRRTGLGGVKRPPFPTEDSKRMSFNMLKSSKKPGLFTAKTEAKHLMKPGPSISQVTSV